MKGSEIINYIGKQGWIEFGKLMVDVKILDYKRSYGRDRWLVTPVSGSGQVWVENVRLG